MISITMNRSKKIIGGYCKKVFEKKEAVQPDFNETRCFQYFRQSFKEKNLLRNFDFPEWMKQMDNPTKAFNTDVPTYKEVQKIIRKMKSSGSPCPLDHTSILMLKKCAYFMDPSLAYLLLLLDK